jgi:hypothetical protein
MPPMIHCLLSEISYHSSVLALGGSTAVAGNSATTVKPSPGASRRVVETLSVPGGPTLRCQSVPRAPSRPVKAVQRTGAAPSNNCRR